MGYRREAAERTRNELLSIVRKQVLRRCPRRILPRKAQRAQLQSIAELIARTVGKTDVNYTIRF